MDHMLYPTQMIIEGRGIIPNVRLPRNFRELVSRFYEQGRKKIVEDYVNELGEMLKGTELEVKLSLTWDDELGLKNINTGSSAGLDLNGRGWPDFQEHNIGTYNGFAAGAVAMKYVSELLKTQ